MPLIGWKNQFIPIFNRDDVVRNQFGRVCKEKCLEIDEHVVSLTETIKIDSNSKNKLIFKNSRFKESCCGWFDGSTSEYEVSI